MSNQQIWREAAGHANQEIAYNGLWTCHCESCVRVRARIGQVNRNGRCLECGEPLKTRTATYCSGPCRQKAYRDRKKRGTLERSW